jgi:hypothetical protein
LAGTFSPAKKNFFKKKKFFFRKNFGQLKKYFGWEKSSPAKKSFGWEKNQFKIKKRTKKGEQHFNCGNFYQKG